MNNLASYLTNFTISYKKNVCYCLLVPSDNRVLLGCGRSTDLGNSTHSSIGMDDTYKKQENLFPLVSTLGKTALVEKRAPPDVKAPMLSPGSQSPPQQVFPGSRRHFGDKQCPQFSVSIN